MKDLIPKIAAVPTITEKVAVAVPVADDICLEDTVVADVAEIAEVAVANMELVDYM